jgi:hypothetical protein
MASATVLLPRQAAMNRLPSNSAVIPGAKSPAEAGEMLGRLIDAKSKQLARLQELLALGHRT